MGLLANALRSLATRRCRDALRAARRERANARWTADAIGGVDRRPAALFATSSRVACQGAQEALNDEDDLERPAKLAGRDDDDDDDDDDRDDARVVAGRWGPRADGSFGYVPEASSSRGGARPARDRRAAAPRAEPGTWGLRADGTFGYTAASSPLDASRETPSRGPEASRGDGAPREPTSTSTTPSSEMELDDELHRGERAFADRTHPNRPTHRPMSIVGEEERRLQKMEAMSNDPGFAAIKMVLLAMREQEKRLRSPLSYDPMSEDPRTRPLEEKQRNRETSVIDDEVARYREAQQRHREARQRRDGIERMVEHAREAASRGDGLGATAAGRNFLHNFLEPLSRAIEKEQAEIRKKVPGADRTNYGPFMLMLNPDKLAVITLHAVISQLMMGDDRVKFSGDNGQVGKSKFVRVVERLGEAVQAEVNLSRLKQRGKVRPKDPSERERRFREETAGVRDLAEDAGDVDEFLAKPHLTDRFAKVSAKSLSKLTTVRSVAKFARRALNDSDWGMTARVKLGSVLAKLLVETAKIEVPDPESGELEIKPAFEHHYEYVNRQQRYGMVSWHPAFFDYIEHEDMRHAQMSLVRYMPMVTPPRPWSRFDQGGYLCSETFVMRGNYTRLGPSWGQIMALLGEQKRSDSDGECASYQPVLDALNVLGKTPWVVNERTVDVMQKVWDDGGGIAGVPPRGTVDEPVWPDPGYRLRRDDHALHATAQISREDKREYVNAKVRVKRENRELHSQRCDFLIKLKVAQEMRDEEKIFFPHNIDFRGRAYTMHAHLNHIGSDVCRGALLFQEARPLGENGLDWLYVQAANLYAAGGVDKLPLDERREWMKTRLDRIKASARDPLCADDANCAFWLEAENPWQCLATFIEIAAAVDSGDPASYACRLPVHQDGSCNGLQHYAALGRDIGGGEQVNLTPRDSPGDVYTGVANVLKRMVAEDAADASDPETAATAAALAPHIDRKLVKQTVMTSVYGVTHVGARQQIQSRLRERGAIEDESLRYRTANYASRRTLDALSNLFVNAREVMSWLGECARVVSKGGKPVQWTTPMGLPVVQPYKAPSRKVVRTIVQSFVLQYDSEGSAIQKQKQKSAFPPNFIHSVDSAHMMKTALACQRRDIAFAGVHDSFWTHARDVDAMNEVIRDTFVELHSEPLMTTLYEELRETYPEAADEIPKPPPLGELDLNEVKKSRYFFS